ncbi:MAG: ABC transporter ATP-binding protein [Bdellovibrionales bacterium]|nr:ABC transporter ATP-binding protein [Bdellovibrionales bacterium]
MKKHPYRYYFKKYKKTAALGLTALAFTDALEMIPPLLIGRAIDQMASGAPWSQVVNTVFIIFAVATALATTRYFWRIHWGRFHHYVAEDMRNHIFNKLTLLGPSYYQRKPVGELMSLISNDVNSFRMAIGPGVLILGDALLGLLIIPPIMYSISPEWTWKTLILMPLIPLFSAKIIRLIHTNYRRQQDQFSEVSGCAQEIVSGVREIKSYGQESTMTSRFNFLSRRYEWACNQVAKVDSFWTPMMEFGVTAGGFILLLVGAPQVIQGAVTIGAFFAFYQYINKMIWPASAIGVGVSFFQQGNASFKRILEVLDEPIDIPDTGESALPHFESLQVKNLSFTYPDAGKASLWDVSFTLKAGDTLGIVGRTGSGKSTLVDLINRLYPIREGSILINDKPIESYSLTELRNLISYVPQEAFLFSEKVSENIALGLGSSTDEVAHYSHIVNLDKEILAMPEGYSALIGERGVNLSGGQKQRLTIARALIRKTPIVILDDSLSAVDTDTESHILERLQSQAKGDGNFDSQRPTTLIVSHRLACLKWADRILVLDAGRVEAVGTYSDLLKTSKTFKQLHQLQNQEINRAEAHA